MATKKSTETAPATDAAPAAEVAPAPEVAPQQPQTVEPVPAREHANADRTAADSADAVHTTAGEAAEVPVEEVPVVEEPITASADAETRVLAETTPPQREVIVVDAPVPPRKRSNRVIGIAFALLASLVFAILFALALLVIGVVAEGTVSLAFLTSSAFYWPIVLFFLSLVIVIAIVNTASWWTYIVSSVIVAAGVYFGIAAVDLVLAGVLQMSRQEADATYLASLANPATIAAAIIAREVAIWTGAILGRRGRRVRARNAEEREAYEREQAALTPTA